MKTILPAIGIALLVAILGLGSGCARKSDDARISSEIQSKFSQDSGLSSQRLNVESSNGLVTLAGSVENNAQRAAAARQAASVAGVKQVINNLQVGSAAPAPTPSPVRAAKLQPPVLKTLKGEKPSSGRKSRHSDSKNDSANADASDNTDLAIQNSEPPVPEEPSPSDNTVAAAPVPPPPPPPTPAPKKATIDQGTQLTVRLVDGIDSEKNETGQTFHATLNAPLSADGNAVIPAGTDVTGHIADLQSAGKFKGQSLVVLQLDSMVAGGTTYNLQTDQYRKEASSRGKNTAEKVGAGAVVGAVLGGILGGGKGAGIGAAAGAGAGGGVQAASKSQQIKLPPETVLNFTLQAPLTVTRAPNPDANRPKLDDPK